MSKYVLLFLTRRLKENWIQFFIVMCFISKKEGDIKILRNDHKGPSGRQQKLEKESYPARRPSQPKKENFTTWRHRTKQNMKLKAQLSQTGRWDKSTPSLREENHRNCNGKIHNLKLGRKQLQIYPTNQYPHLKSSSKLIKSNELGQSVTIDFFSYILIQLVSLLPNLSFSLPPHGLR